MAHKLKITLNYTDPKVYRTVIVPENFNFHQLHIVIQLVMNWTDTHLYQFNVGAPYGSDSIAPIYEDDDDDFFSNRYEKFDSEKALLSDYFNGQKKKMNYIYDFGDDWHHIITVLQKPKEEVLFPKCIKGENAAPIDDCGSYPGFYNLIAMSHKKNKTEEDREHLEWYGILDDDTYEETYPFDIDEINATLLDVFSS